MTTARDLIESAARKLHVLGRGQTLSADEAQDFLESLNNLLSSWSVEGGMVFKNVEESFPLTGNQSYTIGVGGVFNTEVPYKINTMYASSGGLDYYMHDIGESSYESIPLKQTGSIPELYYFNYNYPVATISVYPVAPSGYTLTISSMKRLTEFSGLTTDVSLPPEYKRALIFNLAMEMADNYEKQPSMNVMRIAKESKANVFSANDRNNELLMSPAYPQGRGEGFNILKGGYV